MKFFKTYYLFQLFHQQKGCINKIYCILVLINVIAIGKICTHLCFGGCKYPEIEWTSVYYTLKILCSVWSLHKNSIIHIALHKQSLLFCINLELVPSAKRQRIKIVIHFALIVKTVTSETRVPILQYQVTGLEIKLKLSNIVLSLCSASTANSALKKNFSYI
jgi:hypothetical protein